MASGAPRSRWRLQATLLAVTLLVAGALLELALPMLDGRYLRLFARAPARYADFDAEARAFLASESFDPELGWDHPQPAHDRVAGKTYSAQAYGDSFVKSGHGGTSWQEAFEAQTGEAILNLGVSGYGLDQAVLKFERHGASFPTRIAILGLYHQTFRRTLSYHALHYFWSYEEFKFAFKPIFVPRDGGYERVGPPCRDVACLRSALLDPRSDVARFVAEHDYWYRENRGKPTLRFPRLLAYARGLSAHWRRERRNYFFVDPRSLEVTRYLVRRFADHAERHGMVPVGLLLYGAYDLALRERGARLDAELVAFLEEEGIRHVDSGRYILGHHREDDGFRSLETPDTHLNDRGDALVAAALAEGLAEMGLLSAERSTR